MNANLRDEQVWLAVGSLMILAVVSLAGALFYTRAVMIPFVMAIFITTAVSPIVDRLVVRFGVPSWLAIAVALILVLAILVLLGAALAVAVQTIVRTADEYTAQVADLTKRVFVELHAHGMRVEETRVSAELQSWLPGIITTAAGTVTSLVSDGILVLFFVIFLLSGRDPYQRQTGIYAEIESAIREYIVTKTAISAVAGVLVGTLLWMMGLRMAFLFGLLAFLLNFIPNVGPIVASLLPIPIADGAARGRSAGHGAHDDRELCRTEVDGPRPGAAPGGRALGTRVLGADVGRHRHGARRANRGDGPHRSEPFHHDSRFGRTSGRTSARSAAHGAHALNVAGLSVSRPFAPHLKISGGKTRHFYP
jgi:hypothetical protein